VSVSNAQDAVLEELCRAAQGAGVVVSFDALSAGDAGAGGLCKVRGEWRLIGDKRATVREKIDFVATALLRFQLDRATLSDGARAALERAAR
jgi:hypothetical protein